MRNLSLMLIVAAGLFVVVAMIVVAAPMLMRDEMNTHSHNRGLR